MNLRQEVLSSKEEIKLSGVFLDLENYERRREMVQGNTINILAYALNEAETINWLDEFIAVNLFGNKIDTIPRCNCPLDEEGNTAGLKGVALLGETCYICNSTVQSHLTRPVESELWLELDPIEHEFDDRVECFISPSALMQLETFHSGADLGKNIRFWSPVKYLMDAKYPIPDIVRRRDMTDAQFKAVEPSYRLLMERLGHYEWAERSIRYFRDNLDQALEILKPFRTEQTQDRLNPQIPTDTQFDYIIGRIRRFGFPSILAMPSRLTTITETAKKRKYITQSIKPINEIINASKIIQGSAYNSKFENRNSAALKVTVALQEFFRIYSDEHLHPKIGLYRRSVNGVSQSFSMREVITSSSERHHFHDLLLPRRSSLTMMYLHIASKLLKRPNDDKLWVPTRINQLIKNAYFNDSPIIDEVLEELFHESFYTCPYDGRKKIPGLFSRAPALLRGSIQLLAACGVKKDPYDNSIGFHSEQTGEPNADYDGDYMCFYMLLDKHEYKTFEPLHPKYTYTGIYMLGETGKVANLKEPVYTTLANKLHTEELQRIAAQVLKEKGQWRES